MAFPDDPYLFLLADPAEMAQVSDGSGGAPAATNDPVGLWQDTSGNDRHFSQATADQVVADAIASWGLSSNALLKRYISA